MLKILVVEDDWEMNRSICYILEENGYETVSAHSIAEAQKAHEDGKADLVLLDVNLPDGEGFGFCGWLRERSRVPVLFLTARDLEEDALRGYELGAEDYVTKPFSMKILLKKIDVVLKRSSGEQSKMFDDGFLRIDLVRAKADAFPGMLSGGQQQRAAIARAVAAKPSIILADEPTGNLDTASGHDVMGLLKVAAKQFQQTVILITHDNDIAQMADRIVHIEDGKIVKAGDLYAGE